MHESEIRNPMGAQAANWSGIDALSPGRSIEVLYDIVARFGIDASQIWWWTSEALREPDSFSNLEGPTEFAALIREHFARDELLYFVPTDDEPAPWVVYLGHRETVISFLNEHHLFEYMLASERRDRIAFETHHNRFITMTAAKHHQMGET